MALIIEIAMLGKYVTAGTPNQAANKVAVFALML